MKRNFLATALIFCALVLVPATAHAGSEPEGLTPESVSELAETGLSTGESWLLILALFFLVAGATFSAWSVKSGEWSDDEQ